MRTTERKEVLRYFFSNEETTPLDEQIDAVLSEMTRVGVASDDYSKLMTYLERLNDVKAKERQAPVSRDTLVLVFGNLMGIIVLVAAERKAILSTKGFSQLIRPKSP